MRAFNAEQILQEEFERHQDLNTGVWFMFLGTSNGFGILMDLMVYAFTGCVIYFFLVVNERRCFFKKALHILEIFVHHFCLADATGDRVGIAIMQALSLIGVLQISVRRRKYKQQIDRGFVVIF